MKNANGDPSNIRLESKENGVIVVFSCNTCPFVVGSSYFPGWENQYNALHSMAQNNDIGFVLINSNEAKRDGVDSFEEMKKHAKKNNYLMSYLLDENSKLANFLKAKTTPHVFFFDANFRSITHWVNSSQCTGASVSESNRRLTSVCSSGVLLGVILSTIEQGK